MNKRWLLLAGSPLLASCWPNTSKCGAQELVAWDGGLADGGAISQGSLDYVTCQSLCPPAANNVCNVVDAGLVQCTNYCVGGRAPPGLISLSNVDSSPGSWLARMAELEAAAVHAFVHLAGELDAHGLPDFAAAAMQAAQHEVKHATAVTGLALRYGVVPRAPVMQATEVRSLDLLAIDNAGEGCGREFFGAEINAHQARTASDPAIARVMGEIVGEERSHAAFSFSLANALMPRLTVAQRRRAREAQASVLEQLGADEAHPTARTTLGLMTGEQSTATARVLLDEHRLS